MAGSQEKRRRWVEGKNVGSRTFCERGIAIAEGTWGAPPPGMVWGNLPSRGVLCARWLFHEKCEAVSLLSGLTGPFVSLYWI
jgi:hypothetical protein